MWLAWSRCKPKLYEDGRMGPKKDLDAILELLTFQASRRAHQLPLCFPTAHHVTKTSSSQEPKNNPEFHQDRKGCGRVEDVQSTIGGLDAILATSHIPRLFETLLAR